MKFWLMFAAITAMAIFFVCRWHATRRLLFPVLAILIPLVLWAEPAYQTALHILQAVMILLILFFLFFPFQRIRERRRKNSIQKEGDAL